MRGVNDPAGLGAAIEAMPDSSLKTALQGLAASSGAHVEKLGRKLSVWIDRSLTIVGETYKRRMYVISFII